MIVFIIFQYYYLNIKIFKFDENFEIFENFIILKFFEKFRIFLENVDLLCDLMGRLEMKSRLWLDNVETPNRPPEALAR